MSERGDSNNDDQAHHQKSENLNFSFQDILDNEGVNNPNNPNFQHIVATFQNHDNQSASYNNLPAELQHLFSMSDSNASSSDVPATSHMWNSGTPVKDTSSQESAIQQTSASNTPNAGSPFSSNNQANSPAAAAASLNNTSKQASPLPVVSPSAAASPQTRIQSTPSPMATTGTPQTQSAPSPSTTSSPLSQPPYSQSPQVVAAAAAARSSPQVTQSPKVLAPQAAKATPPPGASTPVTAAPSTTSTENAPSSMTLLDNITAQLSPDRKERFIELFRQLQTTAVTAPEFLAQAKQLLDQQQYQQLENLKSKPSAPHRPNMPIQPHHQQQALNNNSAIKRPMSSSQVRAEDTQRAMSGLIAPQAKRARSSADIPTNTSQPSPLYRSTPGTPIQQQQQHLIQQKQQQLQLQQQQLMMQQQQQMKQHLLQQHQQQQLLQQQAQQAQVQAQAQQQQQQQQAQQQTQQPQPLPVEVDDGSTITQSFMNTEMLTAIITKRAQADSLKVGADVVTLIALATQERMIKFIHHMIAASKHRVDSQTFTQPTQDDKGNQPFKIADVQDIKKQLLAIERVEREEERKRKEIISERERKAQLGEEANEGENEDGKPTKKKKKKDMGPGVTARYMSDDVRNKTTNETALMIAGGVMKSWMLTGATGGGGGAAAAKEKPQPLPRSNSNMDMASPSSATTPMMGMEMSPLATSPTNGSFGGEAAMQQPQPQQDEQPRGRGRPRRRKSASGPDLIGGKKVKGGGFPGPNRSIGDGGLTLPPSKIGRPHRLGEQSARKLTARDALFVLEDENENKRDAAARRTLLKAYATLR